MNKSLFFLASLATVLILNACTATLPPAAQPNTLDRLQESTANPSLLAESALFKQALSQRDLEVSTLLPQGSPFPDNDDPIPGPSAVPTTSPNEAYGNTPVPFASVAPSAMPFPMPGNSAPAYGYFPGGDFNTYLPFRAEELRYAGNASSNLQAVYAQAITPIIQEWDSNARLLEARGNTRSDALEPISLPGTMFDATESSSRQFKANWVFRFASSPRKETLTLYVNAEETLVYRMVYAAPSLPIEKATLTSEKALEIAKAAFKKREDRSVPNMPPDMPPDGVPSMNPQRHVFYDLPQDLNWRTNLVQQDGKLVYIFSFGFETTRTALGLSKPLPSPLSTPQPTNTPNIGSSPYPLVTPTPGDVSYYCGESYVNNRVYLSGSASIDAMSGKVLVLSHPIYYDEVWRDGCSYGTGYIDGYVGEPYPRSSASPST